MPDRLVPARLDELEGVAAAPLLPALRHMQDILLHRLEQTPSLGPAPLSADEVAAWSRIARAPVPVDEAAARHFIGHWFDLWRVVDEVRPQGLLTGYFEPELRGSHHRSATYTVPVYGKPHDLFALDEATKAATGLAYGKRLGGVAVAYDSREEIDRNGLTGRAEVLCWVDDKAALFFMHVQGSGRIRLDSGEVLRLGFAAKSGRPYHSIGAVLVDAGELSRDAASMQSIRHWLELNPSRRDWLLWQNPSYIFFRELDLADPARGAIGASGVQLVPHVSLAIDKTRYVYGTPVWLDTHLPDGAPFQNWMVAADTGSAILGAARGDVYFGWGDEAEMLAGHMKQPGTMHVLLPKRR